MCFGAFATSQYWFKQFAGAIAHCLFQLSLVIGFWFGKHSARIVLMPLNWNGVRLQQFLASIQSLCLQLVSNADSHWPCTLCNLNLKWYFLRNYAAWVRKAIFVSISIWGLCISSRDKSPSASNIKCIGARQSHLGPRNERYRGGRYPDLQIQLCSWITWEPLQFVHDGTNRSSKSFSLPVVSSSCK